MPDPGQRNPCLWRSRAGSYVVGDIPVVHDPRGTANLDPGLINVHEQSHKDLFTNTVYGYVLGRLRELDSLPEALERRRDRLLASLSAKIWTCAEGSATAAEWVTASSKGSTTTTAALEATLTAEYRETLDPFRPICNFPVPFPEPLDLMVRQCLLHAVSESAGDYFIMHHADPPQDFWALADHLDNAEVPDEQLPALVSLAANLTIAPIAYLLDQYKGLSGQPGGFGTLVRKLVQGLKIVMLVRQGINPPPNLALDTSRVAMIAAMDAALMQAFPRLPKVTWSADRVDLGAVRVETKEPEFLLQHEEVAPVKLLERMFGLAAAPGFQLFVVLAYLEPGGRATRLLIAHPMKITSAGLDMAEPYLVARNVPLEVMQAIDGSPLQLVWGSSILRSGTNFYYDRDLEPALNRPLFLELRDFSWSIAMRIASEFPGAPSLICYQLPPEVQISVAAIHAGNLTVFALTPPKYPPDFEIHGAKAAEAAVGTNLEMAAVTVVTVRQSKEHTIG